MSKKVVGGRLDECHMHHTYTSIEHVVASYSLVHIYDTILVYSYNLFLSALTS